MTQKTLSEARKNFLKQDFERGFVQYCKLRATSCERGSFDSSVVIGEEHRQQDGFIHAGLMATMADHTAGYAAFTIVDESVQILSIEFKINLLRPAFGQALMCRSRVIREGRQIIVSESEVYDQREGANEVLVAKAMVTLMAVPKEKLQRMT
jgi:uncharacterized protein (TIGR00369 family)